MAFRERTVTGIVVDGDGTPVTNATVQFKLNKSVGYTSTHVVIDRLFTAVTDIAGEFSVTLWCDEDSLKAIDYIVTFPIENDGQPSPLHFEVISLAYQDGTPKDIGTLIAESQPPPTEVPIETWASLIDSRIGNASIDALGDVVIDNMSLADGQVLTWDDATSKWVNAAPGGGGALEMGVTGSDGTANTLLKTNATGEVANSTVTDNGTTVLTPLPVGTDQANNGRTFILTPNFAGTGAAGLMQTGIGNEEVWIVNDASSNDGFNFRINGATRFQLHTSGHARLHGTSQLAWATVTPQAGGAVDVGLTRETGGLLRVSDGSTGRGKIIIAGATPSSATDTGVTGQVLWDASFVYICTAADTWKRVAIAAW